MNDRARAMFGPILARTTNIPALGYQAICICLTRKGVFKTQLRAILRASASGTVSIMFPMIISVREVRDAKEILGECRMELTETFLRYGVDEPSVSPPRSCPCGS